MSSFLLSSVFDEPIYEISSTDLLNSHEFPLPLPRFLFLVKVASPENSEEAKIFIQKLVSSLSISPSDYQIICCTNLPNNLRHFLQLGGKAVGFGFQGALENMAFTYSFSALQNLDVRQKKEIWAALKSFIE